MDNFAVITMNKDGKIIYKNDIKEIEKRIEDLTENQHIYIDGEGFSKYNERLAPNRFIRVFVNNVKTFQKGAHLKLRLHHFDELNYIIRMKDQYEPNTKVFFMGSPEFLESAEKYIKELLINVINTDETSEDIIPEVFKQKFQKRKDIKPQELGNIRKYKSSIRKEKTIEIADNGMKIVKEKTIEINDDLNKPDYYFYQFRR